MGFSRRDTGRPTLRMDVDARPEERLPVVLDK